jgi:hypothetical protein
MHLLFPIHVSRKVLGYLWRKYRLYSAFIVLTCIVLVTSKVLHITSRPGVSTSRKYLHALTAHEARGPPGGTATVTTGHKDNVYLVPIQFGKQKFLSVLDTGSSDTWMVGKNFRCVDLLDRTNHQDSSICRFGPVYNTSSTFRQIPDQVFDIEYSDGEQLSGIMGREDVRFAGMTVPAQTIGVVDYAAWMGDMQSSGLVGLAYPNITRAYMNSTKPLNSTTAVNGTRTTNSTRATGNTKAEREGASVSYSPIFTSMIEHNLTTPMFSLALGEPGVIAFGGLPGAPIRYNKTFTRAPIEFLSLTAAKHYQFYSISVNGFSFSATKTSKTQPTGKFPKFKPKPTQNVITTSKARTQVIIDSGTALLILPANVTRSINALWSPPASYNKISQTYLIPCNASPPKVGVNIANETFWVNPEDMIQDAGLGRKTCMSGVQPGHEGASILGDVFLKSVVAVFDVGVGEMRFAARL